jgi:hypothetical protein
MPKGGVPKPNRADAKHEAAHAVVSVRAGLPLASTSIRRGLGPRVAPPKGIREMVSLGYTTLAEGSAEAWVAALPTPDARWKLKLLAAQTAAGIVAEQTSANRSHMADHGDLQGLVNIAAKLGIGESSEEPAVQTFIKESLELAEAMLTHDNGLAWDRVTSSLLRKKSLTGDEVRQIVERSPNVAG